MKGLVGLAATTDMNTYLLAWDETMPEGGYDVVAILLESNGTEKKSPFVVNKYTNSSQHYVSTASLSDDRFVLVWQSSGQLAGSQSVYARIIDSD